MRQTMRKLLALLCAMAVLLGLTACQTSEPTQETEPALQEQNTQPTKPQQMDPQPTDPQPTGPQPTDPQPTDPDPTDPKPTEPKPTDPEPTDPKPTEPQPTEPQPTEPVSEVEAMQALLAPGEGNWYNYLLTSSFLKPEDVSVYSVFRNGFSDIPRFLPTEAELAYLQGKIGGEDLKQKMLIRIPADRMDNVLQDYLGITLDSVDTSPLVYWEKTDTYYLIYSERWNRKVSVQRVEHQPDGSIRVYYLDDTAYNKKVVTLRQKGDGYQILSNVPERLISDDPQIAAMQALFDWQLGNQFYNDALTSDYATPADVDLYNLFYDGFQDESREATEAETAFLNSKWNSEWIHMDLDRLPVEKMNAVLAELFGITLEQTNGVGLESYPYFEETDCYYHAHTGTQYAEITIKRVEHQDDGTIRVYYLREGFPATNMVVTLKPNGDSYQILSNLPEKVLTDDPEITALQFLFDAQFGKGLYNDALKPTYDDPKDIDLYELFYNGFAEEHRDATAQEQILLEGKIVGSWQRNLIRLPAEKIDEVLMEMFGITLEQTSKVGLDKLIYLEETDCYYGAGHGTHNVDMTVQRVERQADNTILVYYNRENDRDNMVVALKPNGSTYQILSNLPETAYMEPEELAALQIAEEKIQLYRVYRDHGIACDYEHAGYEDMSRFLTEEQKENYYDYQYRILCCHTIEEVKAHISKLVSEEAQNQWPLEDVLFADDEGNLYVTVLPTSYIGYSHIQVTEYSENHIVATAGAYNYEELTAVQTFTLQKIDGEFVIVSIQTEER